MTETGYASTVPVSTTEGDENDYFLPQSRSKEERVRQFQSVGKTTSSIGYVYRDVWRRAMFRIKVQRTLKRVKDDLLVFGTSHELADLNMRYKANIDELIDKKARKAEDFRRQTTRYFLQKDSYRCLLPPNSFFRQSWNLLIVAMLAYTATIMPYRFAFYDTIFWDAWTVWELILDFLFLCDMVLSFFSIYVKASGAIITDRRRIAYRYIRTWFFIDLVASVPYTLFDLLLLDQEKTQPRYNSLLRIVRLPRLYKLLRLFRVLKTFRSYGNIGDSWMDRVESVLQVNSRRHYSGLYKLSKFLVTALVAVHIAACVWYFFARITDFEFDCWVVRAGLIDKDEVARYIGAFYWAVTTMVTVGYGDITPKTNVEIIVCLFWMIIGIGFYTFTIGSLSTFLMSIDTRESILTAKLGAVQELSRETGMSKATKSNIMLAIRYNTFKVGNVWDNSLFDDLPKALKYEVVTSMYGGAFKDFPFLAKRDMAFVLYVMPRLRPSSLSEDEYIYHEGEYADAMHFIVRGRVNFVLTHSEIVYKTYLRGSYIGEIEIIIGIPREDNAQVYGHTELLTLGKPDFFGMMEEFPVDAKEIKSTAKARRRNNKLCFLNTRELLKLKKRLGSLSQLVGKQQIMLPVDELITEEEDIDTRVERLRDEVKEAKTDLAAAVRLLQREEKMLQEVKRRVERIQTEQ